MAHYKRKYPRTASSGPHYSKWESKKRNRHWMSNYPRWWDVVFHTRPNRRANTRMMRSVFIGNVDEDEAVWPLSKKPHKYYW